MFKDIRYCQYLKKIISNPCQNGSKTQTKSINSKSAINIKAQVNVYNISADNHFVNNHSICSKKTKNIPSFYILKTKQNLDLIKLIFYLSLKQSTKKTSQTFTINFHLNKESNKTQPHIS